MTSTELAPLPPATVELMDHLDIQLTNPDELAAKIAMRLAFAATPEELFSLNSSLGWRDRLGEPYKVRKVEWVRSDFAEGCGIYAVVEAVKAETGEPAILTTGATNVVVQLARAAKEGWLDQPIKLMRNEEPTSSGFYPLRLVLA